MAKPQPAARANASALQNHSGKKTFLFEETIETDEGTFYLSAVAETVMEDLDRYRQKLRYTRAIPLDMSQVGPNDPRMKFLEKNPLYRTAKAKREFLEYYYGKENQRVERAAATLLMFADRRNEFNKPPTPWDPPEVLPGMEDELPPITPDLNQPLEARFKRIVDFCEQPAVFPIVSRLVDTIAAHIEALGDEPPVPTDEDGFQPQATD